MVLASQSSHNKGGRRYMTSRRRRPLRRALVVVGVLTLAYIGYRIFFGGESVPNTPTTDTDDAGTPSTALASLTPATATTPAAPAPAPSTPAASTPRTTPTVAPAPTPYTPPVATTPTGTPSSPAPTTNPPTAAAVRPAPPTPPVSPTSPAATTTPATSPAAPAPLAAGAQTARFREALALIERGETVEGRRRLSKLLTDPAANLSATEAQTIRDLLARLNTDLIFSKRINPNDPLTAAHDVQQGQYLGPIARQYKTPWQFLERVNGITANRLRAGSKIKVVQGPFHAVVYKSAYRMDMFLDEPSAGPGGPQPQRIYIRSFDIGHGANNSTPLGLFIVDRGRKLINPPWTNPRTGEFYAADDPKNPIGERWVGLKGIDGNTQGLSGYGIHGTIEPDSIGKQMSMGCVRLLDDDVALVWDMLEEGLSTVEIRP